MTNYSLEKQIVRNVERAIAEMEVSLVAVYPKFFERFPADASGSEVNARAAFLAVRRTYQEALAAQIRWSIWINS
jgi:hypothetical protein